MARAISGLIVMSNWEEFYVDLNGIWLKYKIVVGEVSASRQNHILERRK